MLEQANDPYQYSNYSSDRKPDYVKVLEMLERNAVKVARYVLRGLLLSNGEWLLDF